MASERAREREVHRYYQCWLESPRGYLSPKNVSRADPLAADGVHLDDATSKVSRDKALVAFAQLGCLRLNAKRCIVTLISTTTSYILAEATKTLSLLSGGQHDAGDELWFGTASIPRNQGISENALDPADYTAKGSNGREFTAPALVLPDLSMNERFSNREYAGRGIKFYAGVPILSKAGLPIGVYTVSDDLPRHGLAIEELQFLQDMATTVYDHLENIKNDTARFRGERMVLGLGAFTEGYSTTYGHRPTDTNVEDGLHEISSQNSDGAGLPQIFKGMTVSETDPGALRRGWANERASAPDGSVRGVVTKPDISRTPSAESQDDVDGKANSERKSISRQTVDTDADLGGTNKMPDPVGEQSALPLELRQAFARAANILRECTASDGVVFFDASSANIGSGHRPTTLSRSDTTDTTSSDDTISSSGSSEDSNEFEEMHSVHQNHSGPGKQFDPQNSQQQTKNATCDMLGYSFRVASVVRSYKSRGGLALKETEMRRFLRRYPKGLVMHFTKNGEVSSSDESGLNNSKGAQKSRNSRDNKKFSEKKRVIGKEVIRVVPGARNVIFLPMWDFSKSRWVGGLFVWSSRPERLLNAQDDLVYLKAFSNSVMSEINRLEAVVADKAKTSFIANISHELRSPLHGILGSIEFLQDTAVDPFQSSMITTVETCGKTLLDTVNHVLEYAKLSRRPSKKMSTSRPHEMERTSSASNRTDLEEDVDLAEIVEEVVEAIYAGQTFRSAGAFHGNENSEETQTESSPSSKRIPIRRTLSKFSGAVRLVLDIEYAQSWRVRTQPGAIRRIVMNLLGNSLKYTDEGIVRVSLNKVQLPSGAAKSLRFCITVADTGKGMSVDFAQNHAFSAFTQEDHFAVGVGLGLSIVRQIVSSLGGNVDLKSEKGRGTEIRVWFTVPISRHTSVPADSLITGVAQTTRHMKLCMLDLDDRVSSVRLLESERKFNDQAAEFLHRLATDWFGLQVTTSTTTQGNDVDIFVYVEPPTVEHLLEHHGESSLNSRTPVIIITPNAFESAALRSKEMHKLHDMGWIIEVIAQPCGPQKLARALQRALHLSKQQSARPPLPPVAMLSTAQVSPGTPARQDEAVNTPKNISEPDSSAAGKDEQQQGPQDILLTRPPYPRTLSSSSSDQTKTFNISDNSSNTKHPILLVDDNEVNLKLLVAFVRRAHFPYSTAADGLEAVTLYKEASRDPDRAFKAVVIDIQMPVMDGITATREMRQFETRNRVEPAVIVALTGQTESATQQECAKAGVNFFLSKPVKFKDFLKLLER